MKQERFMSSSPNIVPYVPGGGGFSDEARENSGRIIKGELIKFINGQWFLGKTLISEGFTLAVLAVIAAWVYWRGGKPDDAKTIIRQPRGKLPERNELGDNDKTVWESGLDGLPRDPWTFTKVLYLTDPASAEAYTFSTSSIGGLRAVENLVGQIDRMRSVHPAAVPVVSFHQRPMKTRFGDKPRPHFGVEGWLGLDEGAPQGASAARQLTQQEMQEVERQNLDQAFRGDGIPFCD
jgi:hypothetical protein